jgi:hypothetical protein
MERCKSNFPRGSRCWLAGEFFSGNHANWSVTPPPRVSCEGHFFSAFLNLASQANVNTKVQDPPDGQRPSRRRTANQVQQSLEAAEFTIRSQIIWAKPIFPISRGHYHWQHEPCWYAYREGQKAAWIGGRSQTKLWEIGRDQNAEGGHGTQKPLECMARPIRNHAGDVYDPFLGSGTTMCAAQLLERICYGCLASPQPPD